MVGQHLLKIHAYIANTVLIEFAYVLKQHLWSCFQLHVYFANHCPHRHLLTSYLQLLWPCQWLPTSIMLCMIHCVKTLITCKWEALRHPKCSRLALVVIANQDVEVCCLFQTKWGGVLPKFLFRVQFLFYFKPNWGESCPNLDMLKSICASRLGRKAVEC